MATLSVNPAWLLSEPENQRLGPGRTGSFPPLGPLYSPFLHCTRDSKPCLQRKGSGVGAPIEGLAVTVFLGSSEVKTGLSLQGGHSCRERLVCHLSWPPLSGHFPFLLDFHKVGPVEPLSPPPPTGLQLSQEFIPVEASNSSSFQIPREAKPV